MLVFASGRPCRACAAKALEKTKRTFVENHREDDESSDSPQHTKMRRLTPTHSWLRLHLCPQPLGTPPCARHEGRSERDRTLRGSRMSVYVHINDLRGGIEHLHVAFTLKKKQGYSKDIHKP